MLVYKYAIWDATSVSVQSNYEQVDCMQSILIHSCKLGQIAFKYTEPQTSLFKKSKALLIYHG